MSIDISDKLLSEIQKWIHWHHSGYQFKIDSQAWENILHKSFLSCGLNSTWNAGSHSQGVDIVCENLKISCKGGSIEGKRTPKLTISSHRTTKYETLTEKLNYISENHEDEIWSLVQINKNNYRLHIFKKPNFKEYDWKKTKSGWSGNLRKNKARIQKKMSDQLWFDLDYQEFLEKNRYYDFTIFE